MRKQGPIVEERSIRELRTSQKMLESTYRDMEKMRKFLDLEIKDAKKIKQACVDIAESAKKKIRVLEVRINFQKRLNQNASA